MRIIRGSHKGRIFNPPKKFTSRPTTDKAKESLFNILDNDYYFEDLAVLDLFSGTGSITYEFASRGCTQITSVEIAKKYVAYIQKNLKELFPKERRLKVIQSDVFKFLAKYPLNYDLIFADPPFDLDKIDEIPDAIFNNPNLSDEFILIIEHSDKTDYSKHKYFTKCRNYGKVNFSFFEKNKEETE